MKYLKPYSLIVLLLCSVFSFAQDGTNDPTFNPVDTGFGNGTNGPVEAVNVQADGKIIIGGNFIYYNGENRSHIARLNSDASLDAAFTVGSGANGIVEAIAVQPDGKILIGGQFTVYNGAVRNRIARLNADGTLDAGFNPGTGANDVVKTILVQPDGKILVGGNFSSFNDSPSVGLARLNADGTLDAGFSIGTTLNGYVYTLALQPDGSVVAGGWFSYTNTGVVHNNIIRLTTNGSIDGTFAIGSGPNYYVNGIIIQANNDIAVCGAFQFVNGQEKNGLVRFHADGVVDELFNGADIYAGAESMIAQPDNKILITGSLSLPFSPSVNIMRLDEDGLPDASFTTAVGPNDTSLRSVALQPDGNIIVAGSFLSYNNNTRNYIARLNANGLLDNAFSIGSGTGADNTVLTAVQQPDGKILLGGLFTHYNSNTAGHITRLDANGLPDTSFNTGTGFNGDVKQIALLPDGRIMAAGVFSSYNGTTVNTLARLNADGTLDTTFNPGSGLTIAYDIYSIDLQSDGKLLVAGWFNAYNDISVVFHNLIRINTDGSLDDSLVISTNMQPIRKVLVQPDGKIIYATDVNVENDPLDNAVFRINPDGTPDTSFNPVPGSFIRQVTDMAFAGDGKLMVAGFTNGTNLFSGRKLARLNADGTVDDSFNDGTSAGPEYFPVKKIAVQADGKLIVGGTFTYYNDTPKAGLARLNEDGSLDGLFDPGTGTGSADINALFTQPGGKIIIAGAFNQYNGTGRNRIARIKNTEILGVANYQPASGLMVYKEKTVYRYRDCIKQLIM